MYCVLYSRPIKAAHICCTRSVELVGMCVSKVSRWCDVNEHAAIKLPEVTHTPLVPYQIAWVPHWYGRCEGGYGLFLPVFFYHLSSTFAKFRKASFSFVVTACTSFFPHGTSRLPLNGRLWNFIFSDFSKMCQQNSNLIKICQE